MPSTVPSLLFEHDVPTWLSPSPGTPTFFGDLNLDRVVDALIAGRAEYDLAPYFLGPLDDPRTIEYRHEVFQDLEQPGVRRLVDNFARHRLVAQFAYRTRELGKADHGLNHFYIERFFLNAADEYCVAAISLESGLRELPIGSRGLVRLGQYLHAYLDNADFRTLREDARRLVADLGAVQYNVAIRGERITVGAYDQEADYGEQIRATFQRFQQRPASGREGDSREWEAFAATGVLDLVATMYPDLFAALDQFCAAYQSYLDPALAGFDREVQFYLAYLDYIAPLREAGLNFSYPSMSTDDKSEQALDTFDLALAAQLRDDGAGVVTNDITLTGPERILVVSGPNNGGKTTLARAFGQLHYLARLGCPVPGREVRLFLCDQIFTHFERAEDLATLSGKLQEELDRLHADLKHATSASVLVLNEVFTSTTAQDALFISCHVLRAITDLDALCVCVTFLDELASLNQATVSMVSTVLPDDPATRTHKVVRKPADGRAYARAIADAYGVSFAQLVEEITR